MGAYAVGEMVMKLDERKRIKAEIRKNEKESFNLKYLRLFL